MAIEDCLGDIQRPKIEWGPNFVVSARSGKIEKLAELQQAIEREPEIMARGQTS